MRKFRLIKVHYVQAQDYYDQDLTAFSPMLNDWEECDEDTFIEIKSSVNYANTQCAKQNQGYHYLLVEYSDSVSSEMFADCNSFIDAQAKEKAKQEKAAADAKAIRDDKARARKLKQLAKLKEELE